MSFCIKCGLTIVLITVGSAVNLICFSPIDNENKVLNQEEHSCYKRITTVLVIMFLLMDALLFVCQLYTYVNVFQSVLCCLWDCSFLTF